MAITNKHIRQMINELKERDYKVSIIKHGDNNIWLIVINGNHFTPRLTRHEMYYYLLGFLKAESIKQK
jgi:hypothetical protein